MIKLSLVLLCYRSGEALKGFVTEMMRVLDKNNISNYELILVANYSDENDITPKVAADIAEEHSNIKISVLKKEGMMGWDMKTGLRLASGEYICIMDGDGQMPKEDVARVYNKIKDSEFDLVKTYRTKRGDTLWRKGISFFYNLFFHLFFPGLNSRDINSKPKIFTRGAYSLLELESNDWFIDAEIMIQARRHNFKIGELPTVFFEISGRRSFVRVKAVFEFVKNLIIYRIKEFGRH